ncbi:hypothetical protein MTO96_021937 [Rhipicephalus appendiculatus]
MCAAVSLASKWHSSSTCRRSILSSHSGALSAQAVFASQGGLDAHSRGHTPRLMCTLCMRPFKHKRNLARHMELHAYEAAGRSAHYQA